MHISKAKLLILMAFIFGSLALAINSTIYISKIPLNSYDSRYRNAYTEGSNAHHSIQPLHNNHDINNSTITNSTIIIVDMGSTGTRMHAYHVQKPISKHANNIPEITEIATAKSQDKKAVANYGSTPKAVKEHIIPLYRQLEERLHILNIEIHETPIYFFATAGMRLTDEQQQKQVYNEIKKTILRLGHQSQITTKTISGELEGIFDWLSVNYKLKTIQDDKPTIAALDMGGASTQIAIEYNSLKQTTKNKNQNTTPKLYTIKFSNKEYFIYSKSILGYGLNQTKIKINNFNNKESEKKCNIPPKIVFDSKHHQLGFDANKNYTEQSLNNHKKQQEDSDFNFINCSKLIKSYLKRKKDHIEIANVVNSAIKQNMQFIAFSGYYYKFKFFNSKQPEDLIKSIPDSCHIHRNEFKKKFPHMSELELNEACFDATYLKILLNNAYNIPENYQNFIIPKHDIDWTIGASLYIATEQNENKL